ncbi:oligomeric, coiled-coil, peripheral membrane protein [Apophysomyces ossiformis]|uniref:Autophagy-related protein 11 n=1 Tax=Apophysomyces ossiformis TaxID=679940 RepID=A0A8H7BUQ0_9FUNG|nr:oligomeric, coiled-coil, peripheral membrane protein [Apophysomyces ossiformis]
MTSYGTQVKQEQLQEVMEATGQANATPEEIATLLDVEMPSLEPKIQKLDVAVLLQNSRIATFHSELTLSQTCDRHLSIFTKFDSYSQSLITAATAHTQLAKAIVEEQKSQSMALNVAMTNLESHCRAMNQDIQSFSIRAEKELAKQSALVAAVGVDLDIVRRIQIHESIRNSIWVDTATKGKARLIDFIDEQRILQVKNNTADICDFLTSELRDLQSLASDLKQYEEDLQCQIAEDHNLQLLDTTLADIQEMQTKSQFVRDRINRDLGRIYSKIAELLRVPLSSLFSSLSLSTSQGRNSPVLASQGSYASSATMTSHAKKTLEAFNNLSEIHVNDYLPKLYNYETNIRQKVTDLTSIKRHAIEQFLKNMNIISQLQSEIAAVAPRLERANKRLADFKAKNNPRDLESAREILFAYGALMIEVVRRKEYITILIESSNTIADLLARYRTQEEKRREFFRQDISPSLPFKIQNVGDAPPHCEITTVNNNNEDLTDIERADVVALITLLSQYYSGSRSQGASDASGTRSVANQKRSDSLRSPSPLTKVTKASSIMSKSMSRRTIGRDIRGEKILNLLTTMNSQLDGLKLEFLKALESAFFVEGAPRLRFNNLPWAGQERDSASVASSEQEYQLQQKSKALSDAEEQLKVYETRIHSLEKVLQQNFKSSMTMAQAGDAKRASVSDQYQLSPRSGSNTSSAYSVVDEDAIKQKSDQMDDTKLKLTMAERKLQALTKERSTMQEEIERWKDEAKKRDATIEELGLQLTQEQEKVAQSENEKEDMRFQIHELEQMLEDERHTYEENRKSLLKEAQIKDNLADIRIASVEEDWRDKLDSLQKALEDERRANEELREAHADEIKKIHASYDARIQDIRTEEHGKRLKEEQRWTDEQEALSKEKEALNEEKEKISSDLEEISKQFIQLQKSSENEISQLRERLQQMEREMDDSEQARTEIKHKLSQTRDMVARAEADWMEKHEALEKIMKEQEVIQKTVADLMSQFTGRANSAEEDQDVLGMLDVFKQRLESYTRQANDAQEYAIQSLATLEQDYVQLKQELDVLNEERAEWQSLSNQMADKLEQFRKAILYELTHQLQLPVDEEEAGAMSKKITIGEDCANAWNEIVQTLNVIDADKFVNRVRKKVKEAHELTRRWHKEYKEVKEKTSKLERSMHEKIAFRNFKVGDVALFLPTRNSTGNPWAAFNINAPHYFLKVTGNVAEQMRTREWIVARIVSISEHIVDAADPGSNPFGLMEGIKFYELEVEHWRSSHSKLSKSQRRSHDKSSKSVSDSNNNNSNHDENIQRKASTSSTSSDAFHRRHSLTQAVGVSHDTGLASISQERSKRDKLSASVADLPLWSSSQAHSQPHYSLSRSSSNIIHSYTPSSSSQAQVGNPRECY